MKIDFLSFNKRILITQLLSLVFAFISVIHSELVIANDWLFTNLIMFYTGIILLIVIFTILIRHFLDGKWLNVVLISIPYLIYWFILFVVNSKIYPTFVADDDYGVGLMILLTNIHLWIGVIVASIIGTYLRLKSNLSKSGT